MNCLNRFYKTQNLKAFDPLKLVLSFISSGDV